MSHETDLYYIAIRRALCDVQILKAIYGYAQTPSMQLRVAVVADIRIRRGGLVLHVHDKIRESDTPVDMNSGTRAPVD